MLAAIQHWAFWEIFSSRVFWCGLGGWMVASTIKMAIAAWKTHQFDFVYLVSTGGMPSSHSASVCGLAAGIGYTYGFGSPICVFAVGFAVVTMFDAATVRRAAGERPCPRPNRWPEKESCNPPYPLGPRSSYRHIGLQRTPPPIRAKQNSEGWSDLSSMTFRDGIAPHTRCCTTHQTQSFSYSETSW